MLRRAIAAAGLLLGAAWVAPSCVAAYGLPALARRAGGALELAGVRPALPIGVSIDRVRLTREGLTLELADVALRARPGGLRAEARVGDGSLLLRTRGFGAASGFVRAASLPLERLDGFVSSGLGLRGIADGVYRFGERAELEANVRAGAVVLRAPAGLELPFAQLTLAATRAADGVWTVSFADVRGPPLSAAAHGTIGARGELALEAEIAELGEPARSGFALLRLPTGPLPYTAEIGGTLARPTFVRATDAER